MASSYQDISELYVEAGHLITGDPLAWEGFLTSACRNYKCRFDEQLLIHVQRPDATAVATLETWNRQFRRWVNAGSKGIAVFANDGQRNYLKYYFDVSDTHEGRNARPVSIWQMDESHQAAVTQQLVENFGEVTSGDFGDVLLQSAQNLVMDNLDGYDSELMDCMEGSLLEELGEEERLTVFHVLMHNSVAYMLLTRCGLDAHEYLNTEDFSEIIHFNTMQTLHVIGTATSNLAELILREVAQAVRTVAPEKAIQYDEQKRVERSEYDAQNHIHEAGRLSDTQSHAAEAAGAFAWQIRDDAPPVSGAASAGDIHDAADDLYTEPASVRHRADRPAQAGTDHSAVDGTTGRDGNAQRTRSDAVGTEDEQHPGSGGRNDFGPADLQLNPVEVDLPSVNEQIEAIAEAEDEVSSAFSISQEDIESAFLQYTHRKYQIYRQFLKEEGSKANVDFLKKQSGIGGRSHIFPDGTHGGISYDSKGFAIQKYGSYSNPDVRLSWKKVEKLIRRLIRENRYLNEAELNGYPDFLEDEQLRDEEQQQRNDRQQRIRDARDLPIEEKRETLADRLADYLIDLEKYEKEYFYQAGFSQETEYTAEQIEQLLQTPEDTQRLLHFLNDVRYHTFDAMVRNNAWHFSDELKAIYPMEYQYQKGDNVSIGADQYQITSIDGDIISLRNEQFPLFTKEFNRADFEEKLSESSANEYLKVFVAAEPMKEQITASEPEQADGIIPAGNYRITDDSLGEGSPKLKYARNIAAIHLLYQLEQEERNPTAQEQTILANYVGWGGLSMAFDEHNISWSEEYKNLKMLLPEDQYRAAMESTLTAFYTPTVVIRSMYEALERMGFSQGNILEPSCGVGHFFGLLPESMVGSKLYGIELDPLTGAIAKKLYPKADIVIQGFEETKLPDNHFDVVLGNVPFGDFKVIDERYSGQNFLIHDYFFAKALDKVRPGGVVAFITSKGTMDKENPSVRRYIAQRAELLGAIRLPNDTFHANAGTEVTSDILFLQKRDRVIDIDPDWIHLDRDENGIAMNSYFVQHPEMILGDMVMESGRFGMESVCKAKADMLLAEQLHEAVQHINGSIPAYEIDEVSDNQPEMIEASPEVRNFSYALVDGQIYFREDGVMKPAEVSKTAESRIKGLIEIRDCVRRLIQYQTDDFPEESIQGEQQRLNSLYDIYVEEHGRINSRGSYLAFGSDESYYLLCSLEVLDDEGNFKRKADMFTKRTIRPHRAVTSVETSSEALALSIGEKARVDLDYMQQLTGKPKEEIVRDLQGVIFRIPAVQSAEYVTADEYLSGNIREKLRTAELAVQSDLSYQVNVEALRNVLPKDLSAAEISVRLGATWIPQEDIQQFMEELLTPSYYAKRQIKVRYSPMTGDWFVENKNADYGNVRADSTYGTKRASAYRILEDTLNLRDVRVFDYIIDENGHKKPVLNQRETMTAQAKQEQIKQAFQDWIWKEPERRNRLVRYYNDTFNSIRPREYDGSHIIFGGMNPEITLRSHQVNAIARILYGGNTLLAHKVGAGKTFEMVAAAQESKRLGLCQKSMFVVPNHLVGQWASEYLRLYPSANILVTTKKDFETANRKKFCGRIATGEYDAVIIGHSQFEKIPMSYARQRAQLEQQLDDIERGIDEVQASHGERFTVKQLMKTRKSIQAKLKTLNSTKRKDNVIEFEQLGIDRLFVDESHFYKNLYMYTKMRNVGSIAQTEAQKSSDLFMKCRYLDEITGGRGIVFATGTPLSNSMVELYTNQRYLQYDALVRRGLQHFDAWASTFGETVTALELAPEGTSYRAKTRFAKFYNLPELMQMFREVADIQTADMLQLPVPKVKYHNIKTSPSELQTEQVASLAERAEKVRSGGVDASVDNMLKITNDGRKLALDQRLIDPMLPDAPSSKVNACVENVMRLWEKHTDTRAAQLVFCDLSIPKGDGSFNVYDDMRAKLIAQGIPEEQIRFIHEAPTDAQKKELFAKVRSGEVRILFGSTQKMGAGTNVQDRLIAIHNLDCPWRPSDLEQRQGRIERQGNMFPEVEVYRYVTEKTFDAYLYQLVESKQKFISQIMTSKSPVRTAEDVDEVALSFAEVKMLATGDERFKEKMDLDIQVSKLRVLKQSYLSEHYSLEDRILTQYPRAIQALSERISGYETDIITAENHLPIGENKFSPMTLNGTVYEKKADAGQQLLALCKANTNSHPTEIGSYRGFGLEVFYDPVYAEYCLNLCGQMKHKVSLGADALGNLTRIENEIAKFPSKLEAAKTRLEENKTQLEVAKAELEKPFAFEKELRDKETRLNALNIELNLQDKRSGAVDMEPEQRTGSEREKSTRER